MTRKPSYRLTYQGREITRDIIAYAVEVRYSDKLSGQSSEIDLTLEDSTGVWVGDWYPTKGDSVALEMFYQGDPTVLDCGSFEVDDIEYQMNPDTISIGGQATNVTLNLREKRTEAYESTTLRAIAEAVAARHNLTLVGEVKEVSIDRKTQDEQTDLDFINSLAEEYGQIVKIENGQLIFYDWADLENQPPSITFTRDDIKPGARFRDKTTGTYRACEIQYQNAGSKELITHTETADPPVDSEDILKIKERAESQQQAIEKAREALRKANSSQIEINIAFEGRADVVAGIVIALEGFGRFSGAYLVEECSHSQKRSSGWTTEISKARRVQDEAAEAEG